MSQFVTAAELRTFVDITGTTGRAADANLDLLIQASSDFLERATGRIITASASNTVRTFTSHGRASITIPDLRTASTVTRQGTTLTADSTFWLLPSPQAADIFTGVQLHQYNLYDYRSNPEWFDRNLDQQWYRYGSLSSMPNDVVITGLWGWTSVPAQWKLATLTLAGYEYKRPDSLLANVSMTPEGGILDYGQMPPEVKELIDGWKLPQDQAVSVG
jgi:hypothetical protein